jgi:hypothetical protein
MFRPTALLEFSSAGGPKPTAKPWTPPEPHDCRHHFGDVFGVLNLKPRDAVTHSLGRPGRSRPQEREPARRRFEVDQAIALTVPPMLEARQHRKEVSAVPSGLKGIALQLSLEANLVGDPELPCEGFEAGTARALADDLVAD